MEKELAQSIGAVARQARLALKLTQEDAAERIGVSAEFYARIERGHALPSIPTLYRICVALGVSADLLLGSEDALRGRDLSPKWPTPAPSEPPEIRRLVRRLRRATPTTLRLVTTLVKELERHDPD